MKRILLSIVAVLGLSSLSMAQIDVYEFGSTTEMSGGEVALNGFQGIELHVDFNVINSSNASVTWNVTRKRIGEIPSWSDYLCWGGLFGACYPSSSMDQTEWTSPTADEVTLQPGDTVVLNSKITPDVNAPGEVIYRYYFGTTFNPKQDSVDVRVYITVGLDEVPHLSVSVAPNPSNDYFVVSASGSTASAIRVVDVLGNLILSEKMIGDKKKVDVSNFRNGVYFVIIESDEAKPVTKRIVVRH